MVENVYTKQAGMEPLPGYRLIEPLGSGGYGEVWKCEVAGGIFKAIKFVRGNLESLDPERTAEQEFAAFERIKAIRHPFILSLERVEIVEGELIIAMELADQNLEDIFLQCESKGECGIPRSQLLRFLADAAEALDLFHFEYDLQHLDIKPANLFVVRNHVKVADFGLVQSLKEMETSEGKSVPGGITPQYSSPEVFRGEISRHSDQYSLAIVYQKLLTGTLPFDGTNIRQLMLQHMTATPNLDALPEADRPRVAKALVKNPDERFPSCEEFIKVLTSGDENATSLGSTFASDRTRVVGTPLRNPAPASKTASVLGDTDTKPEKLFDSAFYFTLDKNTASSPQTTTETIAGFEIVQSFPAFLPSKLWKLRAEDGQLFLGLSLEDGHTDGGNVKNFQEKLRLIQHDIFPPQQVVEMEGRTLLLTDYLQPTLGEHLKASVETGKIGLQADELLDQMRQVASALDNLYQSYEVPHLCLNPNSIMAGEDHVWFIDFGFAPFFWLPNFQSTKGLYSKYSAPEIADSQMFETTDQYSLALIYIEMVTGINPQSQSLTQLRRKPKLDLTFMPSFEQRVLDKALRVDPYRRFESCTAFVEALKARRPTRAATSTPTQTLAPVVPVASLMTHDIISKSVSQEPSTYWENMIAKEFNIAKFHSRKTYHFVEKRDGSLHGESVIRLHAGFLKTKLNAFCEQWEGTLAAQGDHTFVIRWPVKSSFWHQVAKGATGLEVSIDIQSEEPSSSLCISARIIIQNFGHPNPASLHLLQETGPKLLESLSENLRFQTESKTHTGLPLRESILVHPVLANLKTGDTISATALSVSPRNVTLELEQPPTFRYGYLHFASPSQKDEQAVLARIIETRTLASGKAIATASVQQTAVDLKKVERHRQT